MEDSGHYSRGVNGLSSGEMNKQTELGSGHNRYRLTPDELAILDNYRKEKTVLIEECQAAKINPDDVKHWWYKSKRISAFVKPQGKNLEQIKAELMEGMQKYSPKFPVIKREKFKDSYCLVIDPCDLHIGKLSSRTETGEDYNSQMAVDRARSCVDKILSLTSPYPKDRIVLIVGNDALHTDTPNGTTTAGTPQDTSGMWYDNFLLAQTLFVSIIEKLLVHADVHVIHNVDNHSYMASWYLAQTLKTWFRNCKQVTFDVDMRPRKAYQYYQNLIGTTHNYAGKENDLPLLLAQEFKKEWAETKYRYIYTADKHHKRAREIVGVTLETSRSISASDGWHSRNGYQHAKQAVEAYLHDKNNGQIARFTAVVE